MIPKIKIEPFVTTPSKNREVVSQSIYDALKDYSCCVIACDKLSVSDNRQVISILEKLFERPNESKLKFASAEPLKPGFSPYGRSKALDTGIKNTLETWDINLKQPINFPNEMISDWNFLIEYQSKVYDMVEDFFSFFSVGIGESKSFFSDIISKENGGIHFIHYLPHENSFHAEARRQSKHFDMTLITVIPASNEAGLEVEINGKWFPVELQPNEFLIQVGLLLERMFGENIKACLHTVETYESVKTKHRYAFPYFVSPSGETKISVLNKFNTEELQKKYPDDFVKNINADYFSKIFKPDN